MNESSMTTKLTDPEYKRQHLHIMKHSSPLSSFNQQMHKIAPRCIVKIVISFLVFTFCRKRDFDHLNNFRWQLDFVLNGAFVSTKRNVGHGRSNRLQPNFTTIFDRLNHLSLKDGPATKRFNLKKRKQRLNVAGGVDKRCPGQAEFAFGIHRHGRLVQK